MPSLFSRPCRKPGCPALVKGGGYCPAHEHIEAQRVWGTGTDTRPSPAARGYDAAWRALRAAYLAAHPRCERCPAAATDVDHIQPVRYRPDLRLEWSNLRSLCHRCHSSRTAAFTAKERKQGVRQK